VKLFHKKAKVRVSSVIEVQKGKIRLYKNEQGTLHINHKSTEYTSHSLFLDSGEIDDLIDALEAYKEHRDAR
jgi:hypothetical protein